MDLYGQFKAKVKLSVKERLKGVTDGSLGGSRLQHYFKAFLRSLRWTQVLCTYSDSAQNVTVGCMLSKASMLQLECLFVGGWNFIKTFLMV